MPFFHYQASDKKGALVEGTVQASTPEEATRIVSQRGFKVRTILNPAHAAPVVRPVPAVPAVPTVVRTKPGSDRELFFLFAQIANQLRAGISPADAFPTLASQISNAGYADSLRRMAAATAEGAAMSKVMAMYPDLYPDHAVGLVRAGEVGGFLPEACAAVSEQAGSAQKFRAWHWFLWLSVMGTLIVLPLIALAMGTFNATFWGSMSNGIGQVNSAAVMGIFVKSMGQALIGLPGLGLLLYFGAIFGFLWWLRRPNQRRTRHKLGYRFPIYGKRSTYEGLTLFSWSLANLTRSGVAPQTAWALAGECVPNMVLRDKVMDSGRIMTNTSRVSEAVFRSGLFPEEYAPTVSTGEMTGDLPGTLERLAQVNRNDFDSQTQYTKMRAGCWGLLSFVIAGLGGMAVFYYLYGRLLSDIQDRGLEQPESCVAPLIPNPPTGP